MKRNKNKTSRKGDFMSINNIKKRILSVVFGLIAASAMVISSCDAVTNGVGTAEQTELTALSASRVTVGQTVITNQAGLRAIESNPSWNYVLGNDITLTGWIPICGSSSGTQPFTGTLDGAGNTITIQSFNARAISRYGYVGIFQQAAAGAIFQNLTVDIDANAVVQTSAQYVGGLSAYAEGTSFGGITIEGEFNVISTNTPADQDVGLVAGYAGQKSSFAGIDIEGDLNVQFTNNGILNVNAGGISGHLAGNSSIIRSFIDCNFVATADMPAAVYPDPDNYLTLGGAAGYAESGSNFQDIIVVPGTVVDAQSDHTSVYAGGVLGRGLQVTIEAADSGASVFGSGPGYNTSAGGIAGYIQQSTVSGAAASGDIMLNAAWGGDANALWMIYAGGLVGYSGGTADGSSSIDHSHATGAVSATSPYPYAGGLVGYNYGYNDFGPGSPAEYAKFLASGGVTATSNGSQITRSYATGSVTATATANGLPYAGGLAGYSSIPPASGSNIENCYATGDVTANTDSQYGWAGGLIGANAQGSIVTTSYATGAIYVEVGVNKLPYDQPGINPGAAGGGIAGVNYYNNVTTKTPALIERSVALNPVIVGSSQNTSLSPYLLHRVAGDLGSASQGYGIGVLDDNYANDAMVITPVWNSVIDPNDVDGEDTVAKPPAAFFTAAPLSWDFNTIWDMGTDGYPILR
jgi:hypothetical protein